LDIGKSAVEKTRWAYKQLEENPDHLAQVNANIRVVVAK
jgi:hypothetical protein